MSPAALEAIIRREGAAAIADQIQHFFVVGVRDGRDFTRWSAHERPGMVVFDQVAAVVDTSTPLRAEREHLRWRMADLLARSYHEAPARQERDAAQQRINEIDHLIGDGADLANDRRPVASILCVNAPEAERARFAAQLPAPDEPDARPVTLLMREQAFVPAPF